MMLPQFYMDDLIRQAIREDINYIDTSADYLIPPDQMGKARFLAKADGVLCGLSVALRVFELLDPAFRAQRFHADGDTLQKGDIIAELSGSTAMLLKGERTALNLIQHMSGIATATAQAVRLVEGTHASITDTRKTLPGLRSLQKYAVVCGGGKNHRYNLSDGAMLKDNHIGAAGGVAKAVAMARAYAPFVRKIEIEVENLDQTREAVEAGADIIMLDNMSDADMRAAVQLIAGRAQTECSGNVTKENIARLKDIGVDFVSSGALTHSAPILDLSMKHLRPLDKEEA